MTSMVKRKRRLWPAVVSSGAVIALAMTGCASGEEGGDEPTESTQDTAVFHMQSDPGRINPTATTGIADQLIGCTIYEGLTESDPDGLPLPKLAKSWEVSEDGLEYTFNLVEANWHDGEPFTSEDVKFTYEQLSSQFGPLWGDTAAVFEGVETPDPQTAVVKLSAPFAPFLLMTRCSHNGAIMPKHIFEGVDMTTEAAAITPVGTGAFKMGEIVPGQTYTMDRNDDYWVEGQPYLNRVIGQVIGSTASAQSALRAGEIDTMQVLPANAANELEQEDGFVVAETGLGQAGLQLLMFNTEREPFSNPEVRKALYQAIDRDYVVEKVFFGRGQPGISILTSQIWAYTGDVDLREMYPFDPDAAAAALDAAGYPVGADGTRFSLDFLVRNDPPERPELANVIAAMWDQIGVEAKVRVTERAAENVDAFTAHNFDVNIQGYTNYGDPAAGTARAYTCAAIGRSFGNVSQFCDPEIDEMWAEASRESDVDRRTEMYAEIEAAISEQLPVGILQELAGDWVRVENLDLVYQSGAPNWASAIFK